MNKKLRSGSYGPPRRKPSFRIPIIHVLLGIVTVLFLAVLLYKLMNFGVVVEQDDIFADGPGEYKDTFDTILPLLDADSNPVYKKYSEGSTILLLGNAPFADGRDSEDGIANIIRRETGATVYNCSVNASLLSSLRQELSAEDYPWDIFSFYWLCRIAGRDVASRVEYLQGMHLLGDSAPPETREVYYTLTSLDLNQVDVVAVMYDASDYLAGRDMWNDQNDTDITSFAGASEAGIEYLQTNYPNIRIIFLSPTYAYGLDAEGNYVSSDIQRYGGQDGLSTYVLKQCASCISRSVTFVDNLYGTISESEAGQYLTDHLRLNPEGRKKVAERFLYALSYFSNTKEDQSSGITSSTSGSR